MTEQIPSNGDEKIVRNVTVIGALAGMIGTAVCIYGINYDHSAATPDQEDSPSAECIARDNSVDVIKDPESLDCNMNILYNF